MAALRVLFDIPALLHRLPVLDDQRFRWVRDALFRLCSTRDRSTVRIFAAQTVGRPEEDREAVGTFRLFVQAWSLEDNFCDEYLKPLAEGGDQNAIARLAQRTGAPRTKRHFVGEVACVLGISSEAVQSRLRKAITLPEIRAEVIVDEVYDWIVKYCRRRQRPKRR